LPQMPSLRFAGLWITENTVMNRANGSGKPERNRK
jgi:hypothetical protein